MKNSISKTIGYYLFFITILIPFMGTAQMGFGGESDRIKENFKFIPLPYLDYNISTGYTVGFIPMAMFNPSKKDSISPSSTAGLFGMYSQNKSKFVMGFGMLYLNEDRWRVLFAGGMGDFNFQAYASNPYNRWFNYNTDVDFSYLSVQRRIAKNLYLGAHYEYVKYNTKVIDLNGKELKLHQGLGVVGSMDKRDNIQYPRKGSFLEVDVMVFPKFLQNPSSSTKMTIAYNHYFSPANKRDVIAARVFTGIGFGDLSFNQQFIVGETDIRGYSFGKYRGKNTIAAQGEYRWNFHKRFGAVGFGGVATIFDGQNPDDDGKLLPAIGTGIRYNFMKETHTNVGIDIAKGIDDWGLHFRISEAF